MGANTVQHVWGTWDSAVGSDTFNELWLSDRFEMDAVTSTAPGYKAGGSLIVYQNPFSEYRLWVEEGDVIELDLTYPFYRLEITELNDNGSDMVTSRWCWDSHNDGKVC